MSFCSIHHTMPSQTQLHAGGVSRSSCIMIGKQENALKLGADHYIHTHNGKDLRNKKETTLHLMICMVSTFSAIFH